MIVLRYFILVFILFMPLELSGQKKLSKRFTNNDSTAIYSTHRSRPFRYGYACTPAQCEEYKEMFLDFEIKNGEYIADIGAASGWIEGIFSTFSDSVHYYIQDIDRYTSGQDQMDAVIRYYNSIKTSTQTNTFNYIRGKMTKTNLPNSTFDKIVIINALHEMDDWKKILMDASQKIKPRGQIILRDYFSNIFKDIVNPGCNKKSLQAIQVVNYMQSIGYSLTQSIAPFNSFFNHFIFERKQALPNKYLQILDSISFITVQLNRLCSPDFSSSSDSVTLVYSFIKPHLPILLSTYRHPEVFFIELAKEYKNQQEFKSALNVILAANLLFPNKTEIKSSMMEIAKEQIRIKS